MAMKVKPSEEDTAKMGNIPSLLTSSVSDYQRNVLEDQIRAAVHKTIAPSGASKVSKFLPSGGKPRAKLVKKKSKVKDTTSCNKQKTKPVLTVSDEDRYALWWSFNTDLTKGEYPNWKGMKVYPLNLSTKEKDRLIKNQQMSRNSRLEIETLKAVGITPRSERNKQQLIGTAPHPGSPGEFSKLVSRCKSYERELIDMYCAKVSVTRWSPFAMLTDTYHPINTSDMGASMEDMIDKLENIVAQDKVNNPYVLENQPPWQVSALHKATAAVFDMDVSEVVPSVYATDQSANDSVFYGTSGSLTKPGSEPLYIYTTSDINALRKDQWTTNHETIYRAMTSNMKSYRGSDAAKLIVQLRRVELRKRRANQVSNRLVEPHRYLRWLRNHDSSYQRELVESRRNEVDQSYVMKLGMQVHPLYHGSVKSYGKMIEAYNCGRIRAFDDGYMGKECFGTWFTRTEALTGALEGFEFFITDQVNKEKLAEKLVSNMLVHQVKEQFSFVQWAHMFEKPLLAKSTTVSKNSLSPMTDAIFEKWDQERTGAEVVDIAAFRAKRTEDLSELLAKVKPRLSNLTEEQKEGARMLMEALGEMLEG